MRPCDVSDHQRGKATDLQLCRDLLLVSLKHMSLQTAVFDLFFQDR